MTEEKNTLNEQDLLYQATKAKYVERGLPEKITICHKVWKLRPISMRQSACISNLAFDTLYLQNKAKQEGVSLKEAKRINTKIRQVAAKQAAHYILGKWLWLIPFSHFLTWRRLYNNSEEVSATINTAHTVYGHDKDFFIANLENIKFQLALSMRQVGEIVKQKQEREVSAENMLDEDALPKKAEDNKSEARSKHLRTTRK